MSDEIWRPIFIIGPGRSGTTLLLKMMAVCPEVAWFSGWTNRLPQFPQLALLSRLNEIRWLRLLGNDLPGWPSAGETYRIWNACFANFSVAERDWNQNDYQAIGGEQLKKLIWLHQKWQGKSRFLTKYTGWPRMSFLQAVFPDAQFIYVDRDPRAVVFSYLKQNWWPNQTCALQMVEKLQFYSQKYLEFFSAKESYQDGIDYFQARYEHLTANPTHALQGIYQVCNLSWRPALEELYASWPIHAEINQEWQAVLSAAEKGFLEKILQEPLLKLGYLS